MTKKSRLSDRPSFRIARLAAAAIAFGGCACVVVWAKPFRIPIAHTLGVRCVDSLCYEKEIDRLSAERLYRSAVSDVARLHPLSSSPRFIFCRTTTCYQRFGGGKERAISYPFLGTIIAPASWQPYIVRHELVHWLQFQEFGAFGTMQMPLWLREGMAYSLSEAPAWDIPEDHRKWVLRYEAWAKEKAIKDVWKTKGDPLASRKP